MPWYEESMGLPHEWVLTDIDLEEDDMVAFECDHCSLVYILELFETFDPPLGDCPLR